MNPSNVKLILAREIRDQLRDRRTLFIMLVLPVLLYPLLGMSFVQIIHFRQEQAVRVLVVGAKELPENPPLVVNNRFAAELFGDTDKDRKQAELLQLEFAPDEPADGKSPARGRPRPDRRNQARLAVHTGKYDAALCFPDDFNEELERFRQAIEDGTTLNNRALPRPEIVYTTANEKSQVAFIRLTRVLNSWIVEVGRMNLIAGNIPSVAARPFDTQIADVATDTAYHGAAIWSKILPVLLLIWALTGAFYPAVDLCAGEKERGTLETLLSSPAQRSEIVLGKLLTIMIFSMVTAALNLASVGATGWLVLGRFSEFGLPPLSSVVWLALALVPMSALFSALCLALAAFARSTKEGQYYLMPLLFITLPLAVLPMTPGVELNLGNSLIPVAGVVLLLRHLLEGNYFEALQFMPVVVAVTMAACLLAIRWAVDQFNSESVLFRESERLDVGLWMRHLVRDRQPTPTVGGAVFCGIAILMLRFFIGSRMPEMAGFGGFAKMAVITQLVVVVAPALLMTILLTRSPRQTLLLRRPPWLSLIAAALLAVLLQPVVMAVHTLIQQLYPLSDDMLEPMQGIGATLASAPLWQVILLVALLPAVCEELAFRGFILSGFRHLGHKWRAIFYSALIFGVSHFILQQSLMAVLVGVVIGYVAVQTGSLFPCMVFHLVHNTLPLAIMRIPPEIIDRTPGLGRLMIAVKGGYAYHWSLVLVSAVAATAVLVWFGRLAHSKSAEEELQDAIQRGFRSEEALLRPGEVK